MDFWTEEMKKLVASDGRKLMELSKHEGWGPLSRLFKLAVESLDTVQGVKTLRDMQARQEAIRGMNFWMEMVVREIEAYNGSIRTEERKAEAKRRSPHVVLDEDSR